MPNGTEPKARGLAPARVAKVANLVGYQEGAVVSREILKNGSGSVTLFAFDEGESLSEHTTPYDALVQVLEGEAEITVAGQAQHVQGGEMLLMPGHQPHALKAVQRFKMLLTMIRA